MSRTARVERITKETKVLVEIDLDGTGPAEISTGVGFYDHMLHQIARHGGFDLTVRTVGDLEIDAHHTIEDTALALGAAFDQALGDKAGIRRYGSRPCRWTRCWSGPRSTCPAGRTWCTTSRSSRRTSGRSTRPA